MRADDLAETLGVRVEIDVAKKAADVIGGFRVFNVEEDEAVSRMAQARRPEIAVVCEEGGAR